MPSKQQIVRVDGREMTVSNVQKVFFPENGFSKGEVVGFYSEIADAILPHLRDRPLTLKRYPDGVTGDHFYEKNAPKHTPPWVKTFPVPRTEGGPDINYVLCNDRATLVWATNLGDIEKHVLLARQPRLNIPTSIVFDLDPGEPAGLLECAEVALHLRKLLKKWGLETFVKVSGSKGLHLNVPLNGKEQYEVAQPFAKTVAELVTREMPKLVVSEMAKSIRAGKVLIDWSQNSDFKTTVCVYSMRAKATEPFVSMPLKWSELTSALKKKKTETLFFTPEASIKRIERLGDLFAEVLKLKQELPAAFVKALSAGPPPKLRNWPRNTGKTSSAPADKSLREYQAKRDFSKTAEPAATRAVAAMKKAKHHRYVIQKHAASHLHYDWRLEMEGVLRSWAVPKGPPTQLKETRLAMHVEDHPLDYEHFEGTIPPGNYGAGTVMVWDYGVYEDITGNAAAAFHSGKMHIVMKGKKLEGEWILVKDKREPESNRWLLIKAGKTMRPISAREDDRSAISKRSMAEITEANDAQWQSNRPAATPARKKLRTTAETPARFVEPMQCKAVPVLPDTGTWRWEIKYDGYRCLAVKNGDEVELFSRNENRLNDRFGGIVDALRGMSADNFAIDGEVVALDRNDRPSFQLLQNQKSKAGSIYFYAFDLVHLEGRDLKNSTLEDRRAQLEELMASAEDPLRLSPLLTGNADGVVKAVQKLDLEGVVGKREGSRYEPGERSGAWIKHRTEQGQEFVIGGYIPGGSAFDSLLVGVYQGKELIFVAKVKNGFVPRVRNEIFDELKGLRRDTCPFVNLPEKKGARRGDALTKEKMQECRWLTPNLVCQVGFVEWTDAGHLRHAKFIAMRDDKPARDVVRET